MAMKVLKIFAALLLSFAVFACENKAGTERCWKGSFSIGAAIVNIDTRVGLGDDSGQATELFWHQDDKISVTVDGRVYVLDRTDTAGESKTATFTYPGTDFPEMLEPTIYEFVYPADGKAALAEQKGTKDSLRKYHFMTAEILANDEYPLGSRALKFKAKVSIVKLSLTNDDFKGQEVTGVALVVGDYAAYTATEVFTGSQETGEVVAYLAVEPGAFPECKVVATCGAKNYEASLSSNTLETGNLYRVRKEVTEVDGGEGPAGGYTDLSADNKTANCYIVSTQGNYKFKAVKANTTEALTVTSVQVLWESFGTATTPASGDLVMLPSYSNGYIYFVATANKGNAVIAAKNGNDIVWSWHIWMTDAPSEQEYATGTFFLDRNLGATSADKADGVKTFGLLYQHGRKDPFLGSSSATEGVMAASTGNWGTGTNNTVEQTILNPTTFMTGSSASDYQTRWSDSSKTTNDPCPAGWRVPTKDSWGNYDDRANATFDYDETGVTGFGWTNSYPKRNVWYPVAGSLKSDYTYAMHESLFFTATVASNGWIRVLSIQNNNAPSLKGISGSWANYAGSIRCVKE